MSLAKTPTSHEFSNLMPASNKRIRVRPTPTSSDKEGPGRRGVVTGRHCRSLAGTCCRRPASWGLTKRREGLTSAGGVRRIGGGACDLEAAGLLYRRCASLSFARCRTWNRFRCPQVSFRFDHVSLRPKVLPLDPRFAVLVGLSVTQNCARVQPLRFAMFD